MRLTPELWNSRRSGRSAARIRAKAQPKPMRPHAIIAATSDADIGRSTRMANA